MFSLPFKKYSFEVKHLLFLGLIVSIFLNVLSYSEYLTYVDSYKYLLNAESFTSENSKLYAVNSSSPIGKFGYSLFLASLNVPFGFENMELVVFAKVLNIVLNLLIGIAFFKYAKNFKVFSLFFFFSPLYFGYSSYVISEYLSLFFVVISLLLMRNIDNSKSLKHICLSIVLGFLPLIRLELFIFSGVLVVFLMNKNLKMGLQTLLYSATTYSCISILLSIYLQVERPIELVTGLISMSFLKYYVSGVAGLLATYIYLKWTHNRFPHFIFLLTSGICLYLLIAPFFSFTFKNALYTDPILYVVSIASLAGISVYGLRTRVNSSELFGSLVISLIGLVATYLVFDRNIDRYAITVFGLLLCLVQCFINEHQHLIHFRRGGQILFGQIAGSILVLFAGLNVLLFPSLGEDYQQRVVKSLATIAPERSVYMSDELYLSYIYFLPSQGKILMPQTIVPSGDLVIIDDSLRTQDHELVRTILESKNYIKKQVIPSEELRDNQNMPYNPEESILVLEKI